jgi:hypothetical protein
MTRYEKLRELRRRVESLASEVRLLKGDFEATEFDLIESVEDCLDDAAERLAKAHG